LTGTDLDTVTTLRLKAADDAKKTLDAKVTVSGDNTTATAALAASDTANITKPVYELFGVDKTNSEHDFGRTISFRLPPTIDDTQTVPAAGTATLKGTNLNGITAVYFYDSADATEKTHVSVLTTTGAAVTFTVPPAAALPACPAATPSCYSIRLQIDDGKSTIFKTGKSFHTTSKYASDFPGAGCPTLRASVSREGSGFRRTSRQPFRRTPTSRAGPAL
jgi:hypothetical protein